jgi:hypothetical protein
MTVAQINQRLNRRVVLAFALLLVALGVGFRVASLRAAAAPGNDRRIALVYLPGTAGPQAQAVRDAYAARFGAAHAPIVWLSADDLTLLDGSTLARDFRAIVLTDDLSARIPEETIGTLESFAAHGGHVAVVGDAGSRTLDGRYRPFSLTTDFAGVDGAYFLAVHRAPVVDGPVFFQSPEAALRWGVSPADLHGRELIQHGRGAVRYPYPVAARERDDVRVDADGRSTPLLTVRPVGAGEVAYIGLPVGSLDASRQPFPMTMLINFLKRGSTPHPTRSGDSS